MLGYILKCISFHFNLVSQNLHWEIHYHQPGVKLINWGIVGERKGSRVGGKRPRGESGLGMGLPVAGLLSGLREEPALTRQPIYDAVKQQHLNTQRCPW